MDFNEDFLHFVWKFRLFNQKALILSSGEPLEVISVGIHNSSNAGPDFENVKLRLGSTLWVGSVEIHKYSSDWERHNHSSDKAYDNTVLHVVYEHDQDCYRSDGTLIPVLVLKEYLAAGVVNRYKDLMLNLSWIPCENNLAVVGELHVENWLSRVLIERLEEKSRIAFEVLKSVKGSWDDTFYILLSRNFGFKTNALPFELLAKSLPQQILAKHKDNSHQIEALIFGQSGFLHAPLDEYTAELRTEYLFLAKKYGLKPLEQYLWKFLRLRPQNFPTIRLAQFAALVLKSSHLFSKILEVENVKEIRNLFRDLPVNDYWNSHYRFGIATGSASARLGEESINNILINSVAVTLYSYGSFLKNKEYAQRAVLLLESVPFETNLITRKFIALGLRAGNADKSQALIQLKKSYCDTKKCLTCAIGAKIVNAD
ncbi:DUF2851 family protein [Pedobacter sp. SYSU D00535]|uniref:DUF2851 family protein n=1 Tax=Pedobacter sp. SYSU D00535 TaxID=2810308 RepID=UPI001A9563CB|nr:DUF2851 family protein [Pedobacter sp. SYSU D00535]